MIYLNSDFTQRPQIVICGKMSREKRMIDNDEKRSQSLHREKDGGYNAQPKQNCSRNYDTHY